MAARSSRYRAHWQLGMLVITSQGVLDSLHNGWTLPNLLTANLLSPLIFLNYYLLKTYFPSWLHRPRPAALVGHDPGLLHLSNVSVPVLRSSGQDLLLLRAGPSPPWQWWSPFSHPFPRNLKGLSLSSCPAVGCLQLYSPIRISWRQRLSMSHS